MRLSYKIVYPGVCNAISKTIPAYDLLTNVAIRPEDFSESIGYIKTSNLARQYYRVNEP